MSLKPFSEQYADEFLSRTEDNFPLLVEKISLFREKTQLESKKQTSSRRPLEGRFHYYEELQNVTMNQKGITTEEVAEEFNEMLEGSIRHQDPTTAFNMI